MGTEREGVDATHPSLEDVKGVHVAVANCASAKYCVTEQNKRCARHVGALVKRSAPTCSIGTTAVRYMKVAFDVPNHRVDSRVAAGLTARWIGEPQWLSEAAVVARGGAKRHWVKCSILFFAKRILLRGYSDVTSLQP